MMIKLIDIDIRMTDFDVTIMKISMKANDR